MLRLLHTSARRLVAASGSASAAAPAPAARAAYRASPVARAAAARPAPAAPAASAPSTSAAAAPASPAAAAAASAPSAPPAPAPDAPGDTSESQWSTSFAGLGSAPFEPRIADILGREVNGEDVEIKPDGLLYLPEIKYRRILNEAFGPGGWGLAPRGETNVGTKIVSREWALVCLGRFVATARGEQEYFDPAGVATASEAAKSNALMRCCKDLGIAHELWSPRWIRNFKAANCVEVWTENASTGRKRKMWRRKDSPPLEYPNKETGLVK